MKDQSARPADLGTVEMDSGRPSLFSPIGLGCYPLGGGYGGVSDADARRTVDAALDHGWTLVDTAESYLQSEVRLGRILQGRRERVFLATKVFPCEMFTPENLQRAIKASLMRLKTDRVDLYQVHGPEDWVVRWRDTPWDEVGGALAELVASGLALRIGVCNLTVPQMKALSARIPLFSTQNLYSLIDRGDQPDDLHLPVETEILPFAVQTSMAFLAYSPLSRGLLSDDLDPSREFGKDDERYFLPRYQPDIYPLYVDLAHKLQAWAQDHGRSLAQLAVAWTLSKPGVRSALVGAKSPEQVSAIAGADDWKLTPDEAAEVESIVATLPAVAKQARMVVWDHFPAEVLGAMAQRRRDDLEAGL
jgi:aryl-alcohol dehydrogenase-like predicted oxidoreductase